MARARGPTWSPKPEDYQSVFLEQNPWHADGSVPSIWAPPVERALAKTLWKRVLRPRIRRFELVLGPRRVGKTTVLYQTVRTLMKEGVAPHRLWWLKMDHPLLMPESLDRLVKTVIARSKATAKEPALLFLDEITYASNWNLWLKTIYDEAWPVRIAGSSSSAAALRGERRESGVGRWEEHYLAPCLFTEYLELMDRRVTLPVGKTLWETLQNSIDANPQVADLVDHRRRYLLVGGFPELLLVRRERDLDETSMLLESQRILKSDAVERAVYRDIQQAFGVEDPMLLERLLYTLAGQVAGVLSPQLICQTLERLSQPTFDKYLSYLEQTYLVFTLPNYSGGEAARQKRGRKLYFVDGAVRNAALQRGVGPLKDPGEMGLLLENMVAGHLHALAQQTQARLYHWREKSHEVDLIYDQPEAPVVFEISMSATHSRRGLHEFVERFPRFRGRCFLVAPLVSPSKPKDSWDEIGTIPLDLLLTVLGLQAEHALAERIGL